MLLERWVVVSCFRKKSISRFLELKLQYERAAQKFEIQSLNALILTPALLIELFTYYLLRSDSSYNG